MSGLWVNVVAALPLERGTYLVVLEKENGRRQMKLMWWSGKRFEYRKQPHQGTLVTHWMSVPRLPKRHESAL